MSALAEPQTDRTAAPRLAGVLETCLYADDLARTQAFYEDVMGLTPIHSDARMRAYDIGGRGVLLLFRRGESLRVIETPGGMIPPHDGAGPLHVAFSVAAEDLPAWERRLALHNVEIEARATWPRGGVSVYFRDPDGHLLELATPGLWRGY
ncbi:MAG: glyoxalase [Hyphomicrobiales bacterium]|nr:glyoxalase [Hyphomicrobiales bacterium]